MVQIQDRNNKVIEIGDLFLGIKFSGEHPVGYNAEMDDSINKILRVTDVEDDDTWGQVVSADNNFYYPANRIRVLGKDMEKVSRLRVGAKFVTSADNSAMRHIKEYPYGKIVEIEKLSCATGAVKADGYWWEQKNVLDNLIRDPVEFKVADESMKALEEAVREMQTVQPQENDISSEFVSILPSDLCAGMVFVSDRDNDLLLGPDCSHATKPGDLVTIRGTSPHTGNVIDEVGYFWSKELVAAKVLRSSIPHGHKFTEVTDKPVDIQQKPATMKVSKQVPKLHLWAVYDPQVDILWGAEETRRQARELNRQMGGGNRIYKMQAVAKVT